MLATLASTLVGCTRKETHQVPEPAAPSGVTEADARAPLSAGEALAAPLTAVATAAGSAARNVRVVGRTDATDGKGVRFAWPGTSFVARFRGTAVSARLRDEGNNVFQVLVDGEPRGLVRTAKGREIYPLVTGLSEDVHEVTLYKRTEAKVGEAVFFGFEPAGEFVDPAPPAERRMEFIGDSITAGYGNEGPGAACTFNPNEQNEYLTYAALTARELKADHVTIAYSGKTIAEMTEYWERTLPARDASRWNHAGFIPQVVVLNVGTNNFATRDPGEERFLRVYGKLFAKVRAAYPDALIVCALGPMLSDAYPTGRKNLTQARKYMQATREKFEKSGMTNFTFLEFPEQNHADGLGCGFHPSLKTHRQMAERLTALVREKMQW